MWTIRFFIGFVGAALIYMIVTQESIPMEMGSVNSRTYSLRHHPVGFMISFIGMAVLECGLIWVHAAMTKEENTKKERKKKA